LGVTWSVSVDLRVMAVCWRVKALCWPIDVMENPWRIGNFTKKYQVFTYFVLAFPFPKSHEHCSWKF
jgi:hypothetical protein